MSQRSSLFGVHPSLHGSAQHFVNSADPLYSNRENTSRYSQSSQPNRFAKQQREAQQRRLQREQRQRVLNFISFAFLELLY